MKPICLDFIKPLLGDDMRNCVLSVPKIKQVIQRLMLKFYESTCRIYPSISPFPYILFYKVRKHLLLTNRIVQPVDTQGQHTTLKYPKNVSYSGHFYRTRVRSLGMLFINSLTHSLTDSLTPV